MDAKVAHLEEQISVLASSLLKLQNKFDKLESEVKRKVSDIDTIKKEQQQQLIVVQKDIKAQALVELRKEFGASINLLKVQNEDPGELLTAYQKRVMDVYNPGRDTIKPVAGTQQNKREFQKTTFTFTEDD